MARLFDDASSEYLVKSEAILSGTPLAFVCFCNVDADITQTLMCITNSAGVSQFHLFVNKPVANLLLYVQKSAEIPSGVAATSTAVSLNTWHHACGIFASSTDIRVLLDGAGKGTDGTNATPASLDTTSIGARIRGVGGLFTSGMIAEAAIYDLSAWPGATDALKADAFEKILPSLVDGFSPLHFPLGLVAYWPLIRGLNDKVGGYNLTATGTTVSNHPRIILPHGSF